MTENIYPQQCGNYCLMELAYDPCDVCLAWYEHWCEVDDSEMDIDWSEYEDAITRELGKDIERLP